MGLFDVLMVLLIGLVVGAIARLLIPGRQPIGFALTIGLGVLGSFVGGFLTWAFTGAGGPIATSGFLMAVVGATLVLGLYVAFSKRRTTSQF